MPLFPDPRIAIATLHGKAEALAPALNALDLKLETVDVDTDALGTFAGDVERSGSPREVVIHKARLGMAASGLPLGLATEASFGPDPTIGFMPLHVELLAFVDDIHSQVLVLEHATHDTNWQSQTGRTLDEVEPLLRSSGFPEHAVIVRPNVLRPGMPVHKGLRHRSELATVLAELAALSADGLARVDTDMRAHMNPTRQRHIATLGEQLAGRLARSCPACSAPGYGRIGVLVGLPCMDCGTPTGLVSSERHGCGACGHETRQPRRDGRISADPGACPLCNP